MSAPDFDGDTYVRERDWQRLATILSRVQAIVSDGQWHTIPELATMAGGSETAVSARLRDLRKPKFGGHTVERRYAYAGIWEYRYTPNDHEAAA